MVSAAASTSAVSLPSLLEPRSWRSVRDAATRPSSSSPAKVAPVDAEGAAPEVAPSLELSFRPSAPLTTPHGTCANDTLLGALATHPAA